MVEGVSKVRVFVDGASRGNPGPAGIGVVIVSMDGRRLVEHGEYVGVATNNQAEYLSLIKALELCHRLGVREVKVFSDSELLVKQLAGQYAVKNRKLKELYGRVKELEPLFRRVVYRHVPREENSRADALANQAINRALKGE
ncbi:MAG: ribonuclease HI family protein [Candidatus Freyarchaeota archaeon]|nr:ribonuclease HI family protein [Candidatus Freyrarchaeum guaymaensis]